MSLLTAFLITSNLDEVVFEGRHQAYGAYQLRQAYQRHLASAGGITLALCAGLLLAWSAWQHFMPAVPAKTALSGCSGIIEPKPYQLELIKQAVLAKSPPPHPRAPRTVAATATEVTKDDKPQPPPTPAPVLAAVDGPAGPPTPGADPDDVDGLVASGPTGGSGSGLAPAEASGNEVVYVEQMPEFAGGRSALLRYLQSHLRYPSPALAAQMEGRVFLSFVVRADGTIADVQVLKGLGYGLDEEALRVVRQMPAWTPGYQAHHAVPVRFTLPITFQIR